MISRIWVGTKKSENKFDYRALVHDVRKVGNDHLLMNQLLSFEIVVHLIRIYQERGLSLYLWTLVVCSCAVCLFSLYKNNDFLQLKTDAPVEHDNWWRYIF